jgi:hypothetical protein
LFKEKVLERAKQKTARRVAAFLILLMAIALLQDRAGLLLVGHDSTSWPVVDGTVITAKAEPVTEVKVGSGWQVRLNYIYEIGETVYNGNQLRFSRRLGDSTQSQAEAAMAEYVPGSSIEVHYDPDRPNRSVIEPGPDRQAWFGLVVGIGLLAIACVFWIVPTRSQSG